MGVERVDNRNPDVSAAIKTFSASKPEVISLVCTPKYAVDFIAGHKPTVSVTQYIALSNSSNDAFVKSLAGNVRGVIVTQVLPSPFNPKIALSREYRRAAEAAKLPVSYIGLQTWVSCKLLEEGITRAGKNPTPESLIQGLESLKRLDLGDFILSFGPNQRAGSQFLEMTTIDKEGRFLYRRAASGCHD